ncbi:ATPase [Streptosporangium sp. NPDC049376]|uniref:RapZ C-terminal domain-containing protein n=1 Tax=Streptosporangium sp. NPDC049376 TaxID=3366192 RepID=UPI0037BBAF9F
MTRTSLDDVQVRVESFGYLHKKPPMAHLIIDLRQHFRDPHVSPELRHMTAHDEPVYVAVLATPGIAALVEATVAAATAFTRGPSSGVVVIAAGCAGGRHRAPVFATALTRRLQQDGMTVALAHRDFSKPVVHR